MAEQLRPERLSDLLIDPREDLNFEAKNWLDLRNSADDKAVLAKAILALANHGGGFIAIGFSEQNGSLVEAEGRPATFDGYTNDVVNGIVRAYCDPEFHCNVHIVARLDDSQFPLVVVPGGHRVPVRARRASPAGNTVQNNAIYVRKPGPRSEAPQSSQEWDALLGQCLRNRRDEMFDHIRDLITGAVSTPDRPAAVDELTSWIDSGMERWRALSAGLPEASGPKLPNGHYMVAYEIHGDLRPVTVAQLSEVIPRSIVRQTGWSPFWYPTRDGIRPYPVDGAVECWIAGDPAEAPMDRDPAHSDFWRISTQGFAFLLRGFDEDSVPDQVAPGSIFDIVIPVWRIGEVMLQAQCLAQLLCDGPSTIQFVIDYAGLENRALSNLRGRRFIRTNHVARQNTIRLSTHVETSSIDANLVEILHPLLSPLYALFDFTELNMALVVEETARMRGGHF